MGPKTINPTRLIPVSFSAPPFFLFIFLLYHPLYHPSYVLSCIVYWGTRTLCGKNGHQGRKKAYEVPRLRKTSIVAFWKASISWLLFSSPSSYLHTHAPHILFLHLPCNFICRHTLSWNQLIFVLLYSLPFPFSFFSYCASFVSRRLPHSKKTVSSLPLPLHPAGAAVVIQAPSALLHCFCYTNSPPPSSPIRLSSLISRLQKEKVTHVVLYAPPHDHLGPKGRRHHCRLFCSLCLSRSLFPLI